MKFATRSLRSFSSVLALYLLQVVAFGQEPNPAVAAPDQASAANSSVKSAETPLYPSRDIRDKSLIAAELSDEAQWLDTEYGKILALYRPTEARKTLGVLILFHAAEDPQYWPPILENLRSNLPRYGWETLAISLPQKDLNRIPKRGYASSSATSAASVDADAKGMNEEATTDEAAVEAPPVDKSSSVSASAAAPAVARNLLMAAYVDAAFQFLREKGQLNVIVLADNSSAYEVMRNLNPQIQENKREGTAIDGPLQALVICNLQEQELLTKTELETVFSSKQLPILDLFFIKDRPEQKEARELHRAVAMRNKLLEYRPLLVDTQPKTVEQDHQSYVLGRVRGFITQKASGTEIKGAKGDSGGTEQR